MNIIEEVLSACISSAKSEPLRLKQGKKYFELHNQLNVMVTMPSGTFKSTFLKNIPKKAMVKAQDYTYPAMVGSIGKKGVVKGYIMKAAGKTLVVDEFHGLLGNPRRALLSISEDQQATRVFGFKSDMKEQKAGKFLKYRIQDNELHIDYVRCSILLSGIVSPHKQRLAGVDDFAFASRFMPISLTASFDDIDDIALGKKEVFNVKYDPYFETPTFNDWDKFVKCYREYVNNMPVKINEFFRENIEFYTRERLHFSRLFSWASRHNSEVDDWEKYLPYIPFFLYSSVASTLTHSEFEIYDLYSRGIKPVKIASMLKCSKAYVSQTLGKIRGLGLC